MKSRLTLTDLAAIVFAALTVAFVVVVMVTGNVRAGQIEHDVILESWQSFVDAGEIETGADVEPFVADLLDIATDTAPGSYCETLASGMAFYAATYQVVVDAATYDAEVYSAMITASKIVLPELDRIATACLEE